MASGITSWSYENEVVKLTVYAKITDFFFNEQWAEHLYSLNTTRGPGQVINIGDIIFSDFR
jgi:hypothetical protein